MEIKKVKINGIHNPLGFYYGQLVCSWVVVDTASKKQTEARIEVSDDAYFENILLVKGGPNLKQSGEPLEIRLKPRSRYFLRVSVTGDQGDQAISDICTFETGKMAELWTAEWIAAAREDDFHPVLKKTFKITKEVSQARLYATGVGLFEAYLDGRKMGEEYLMPYVNNYEQNIQVMTYAAALCEGEHTLEFLLGKGWYMGTFGLEQTKENYGSRMAAIGELYVNYTDGSEECIRTDESWTYDGSDIEDSGIYLGEILNHQLWSGRENPEKPVKVLLNPETDERTRYLQKSQLMDRLSLPVIVKEEVIVKEIIHTPADEVVLDMGQNFAGFVAFHADFPAGTRITFDFGEILQQGNFYNGNYGKAESQFVYVSDGRHEFVQPHFTFFGFRYVRVTGWPRECRKEDFIGKVLYSDIERTGWIETADPKINRLYENTLWGLKSNFLDMPTDCPQRSERLGWTGDAQVFAPTACYHMDTRAFFHKFIKDLRDEQKVLDGGVPNYLPNIGHKRDVGSVWGDIATFLPNTLYTYYGDQDEMNYCYPLMKEWVDYIDYQDAGRGRRYLFDFGFSFGDWLALDGATPTSFKGSTEDAYISSVYYYRSTQIVRQMSERLGKNEEAKYYQILEQHIYGAILTEYFTASGRLAIDTQAGYIIALKFGLCSNREKLISQFKTRLKKDCYQIKCGFVGAPLICTVLAEVGLYELAYDFLFKEGFPSWLYSVNLGATTIWERWNSVLPDGTISNTGMNSLNHYSYGSVMEFVYGYAAGIRPLGPGFTKAILAPQPDIRIKALKARYNSVNGTYICHWAIQADGQLKLHVEIPFNCTAVVELPESGREPHELMAGIYEYEYMPLKDFRKPYHPGTTLGRLVKDKQAMAILGQLTPALAGMAMSGDPEMASNSLEQISHMGYLPIDQVKFGEAIIKICEINVME